MPDLFEYLQSISTEDWSRHTVYVYRSAPEPSLPINKCGEVFLCPDGTTIKTADQEEIELALSRYYGGGSYLFIVKRGSQRKTMGTIRIGGPVKNISPIDIFTAPNAPGQPPQPAPLGDSATAAVASRAFDALGNQERQSAEIGFRAMETAANVMQRFGAPQNNNGGDELDRAMKAAMIQRLMSDPLENIVKMITVIVPLLKDFGIMSAGGNGGNGGIGNELIATVVRTATDRLLNPAPAVGAEVSPMTATIQAVTAIAPRAVEGIHEYRLAMEAQRDTIAMQTRTQQPQRPPVAQPAAQVLPPAQNGASPNPAPGAQPMPALSAELIEQRIVEMLQANVTIDDAAADLFHFLQVGQGPGGAIIPQLTSLGETGLVKLFSTRAILQPAWKVNSQRCIEFIRAFLKYAAEEGNPQPGGTA